MEGTGLTTSRRNQATAAALAPRSMQWPTTVRPLSTLTPTTLVVNPTQPTFACACCRHPRAQRTGHPIHPTYAADPYDLQLQPLILLVGTAHRRPHVEAGLRQRHVRLGGARPAQRHRARWVAHPCVMRHVLVVPTDDALCRCGVGLDTALQPNQSIKHVPFIEELLSFATDKDANGNGNTLLTKRDMSRIQGKRRADAKATNKAYTLSFFHKVFGSSKCVSRCRPGLGLTWPFW